MLDMRSVGVCSSLLVFFLFFFLSSHHASLHAAIYVRSVGVRCERCDEVFLHDLLFLL
jgi:hypothetical protein